MYFLYTSIYYAFVSLFLFYPALTNSLFAPSDALISCLFLFDAAKLRRLERTTKENDRKMQAEPRFVDHNQCVLSNTCQKSA